MYTNAFFQDVGVSSSPYLAAILVGLIRLVGALCGALLIARSYPRRGLLLLSAGLMAMAMFALAANVRCLQCISTAQQGYEMEFEW